MVGDRRKRNGGQYTLGREAKVCGGGEYLCWASLRSLEIIIIVNLVIFTKKWNAK